MRAWWRLAVALNRRGIRGGSGPWILAYHRFGDASTAGSTSWETFREHLNVLSKWADGVTLEELLTRVSEGRATGREVVLTFDDGYLEQAEAARLASAKGFPVTIFIPTAFPDSGRGFFWEGRTPEEAERIKTDMRKGILPPEAATPADLLSWNQIRELAREGVGIESHGHDHLILSGLNQKALTHDLAESHRILTEQLGRSPTCIGYPNGDWWDVDERTNGAAKACGYRYGLMGVYGRARAADMPWRVRRVVVTGENGHAMESLLRAGRWTADGKALVDRMRGRK